MRYSLINVRGEVDGKVHGTWLQNHTGTLETAVAAAIATEEANGNHIKVAVVDEVAYGEIGQQHIHLQRLA